MTVSITSLLHWPSTSVYNTVGTSLCVARVCQRQRRLVLLVLLDHAVWPPDIPVAAVYGYCYPSSSLWTQPLSGSSPTLKGEVDNRGHGVRDRCGKGLNFPVPAKVEYGEEKVVDKSRRSTDSQFRINVGKRSSVCCCCNSLDLHRSLETPRAKAEWISVPFHSVASHLIALSLLGHPPSTLATFLPPVTVNFDPCHWVNDIDLLSYTVPRSAGIQDI